jgi:hypothetical protein
MTYHPANGMLRNTQESNGTSMTDAKAFDVASKTPPHSGGMRIPNLFQTATDERKRKTEGEVQIAIAKRLSFPFPNLSAKTVQTTRMGSDTTPIDSQIQNSAFLFLILLFMRKLLSVSVANSTKSC